MKSKTIILFSALSAFLFSCQKEKNFELPKEKKVILAYIVEVNPNGDSIRSNTVIVK